MIVAYVYICKFKKSNSIEFQKYVLVWVLQFCFRAGIKTFLGLLKPSEEEVEKLIKFLDTVGFHLQ